MRVANCDGSLNPETIVEDRDIYPEKYSNNCLTVYMKHDFYVTFGKEDIERIINCWNGPCVGERAWEEQQKNSNL